MATSSQCRKREGIYMDRNIEKIPANNTEINFYCVVGEALLKTQMAEQALSHSITLKLNPDQTKELAEEFLKKQQSYTLGQAVNIIVEKGLFESSLQDDLIAFLKQRNWLVHKVICGIEEDLNAGIIKEDLLNKIKSISNKAVSIQREIEYDMIHFCASKGRDMSKILALLKLQEQGIRVHKQSSL